LAKQKPGNRRLFEQLKELDTEQRNPRTRDIDLADPLEIANMINREDRLVADRIENELETIAGTIEMVKEGLRLGGRLIYVGAGTSGRLGILDAAECPPTFGTDPEQVKGLIAGGRQAVFEAQEGAEDFEANGVEALKQEEVAPPDIVCGLAASGRTPYVVGALKESNRLGCKTILVTTVSADQLDDGLAVDQLIDIPVGPEAIMGSTRMKSATAQKMVLNMITTGAMVRMGKTYENVMVDLQLSNNKLVERAKRIIMMFAEVNYERAGELLNRSGGHVKTALMMGLADLDRKEAEKALDSHDGFIRKALMDQT